MIGLAAVFAMAAPAMADDESELHQAIIGKWVGPVGSATQMVLGFQAGGIATVSSSNTSNAKARYRWRTPATLVMEGTAASGKATFMNWSVVIDGDYMKMTDKDGGVSQFDRIGSSAITVEKDLIGVWSNGTSLLSIFYSDERLSVDQRPAALMAEGDSSYSQWVGLHRGSNQGEPAKYETRLGPGNYLCYYIYQGQLHLRTVTERDEFSAQVFHRISDRSDEPRATPKPKKSPTKSIKKAPVSVPDDPPPAASGCSKDTDCKGDRICERGTCVNPQAH